MKIKKYRYWWLFLIVIAIVLLGIVLVNKPIQKESEIAQHSQVEVQARYDYNLEHASVTNVHPFLRSVYFSKGKLAAACGTMVLDKSGLPSFIITANHLFSETDPGTDFYDYHVLEPRRGFAYQGHLSRVVLDSMRTSLYSEGIQDIAFCYVGDANPISRTSKVQVSAVSPSPHYFSVNPVTPFSVTSVTTGEAFDIVGEMINSATNAFYVMLYESINGESGSGFWKNDEGGNKKGKLYVLSGDVSVSTQTRRELKIPTKYKRFSSLSAVEIKW